MSETIRNAEEKREPFTIELEEPLDFEYDAKVSFLTSDKLGLAVNQLCRSVFADYEGCKIEISQKNELTLSLLFRHEVNRDESKCYGVELCSAKKTNNSTIDRVRGRDWAVQNGDRYTLTDDAKEAITPWLKGNLRANNGKINWGAIISEYSENVNMYSYKTEQFTKVSGLDLNVICSLLFGKKDSKGDNVVYDVQYKGVANAVPGINFAGTSQKLILWVNQINFDKLQKTYIDLGLGSPSSIIR